MNGVDTSVVTRVSPPTERSASCGVEGAGMAAPKATGASVMVITRCSDGWTRYTRFLAASKTTSETAPLRWSVSVGSRTASITVSEPAPETPWFPPRSTANAVRVEVPTADWPGVTLKVCSATVSLTLTESLRLAGGPRRYPNQRTPAASWAETLIEIVSAGTTTAAPVSP